MGKRDGTVEGLVDGASQTRAAHLAGRGCVRRRSEAEPAPL